MYMKSETYQKEGWLILEDENVVLGAESAENIDSEECFYRNNKNAKSNLERAGEELTDFISLYIEDEPEPSDSEIKQGIEKILEKTHPEEKHNSITEINKNKKISLKVLFVAAILSVLLLCCIGVVGTDNDINIKNGFVAFDGDKVHIAFFEDSDEKHIPVKTLLIDLESKGFNDVLLVEEVAGIKGEHCKITLPCYDDANVKQVCFEVVLDDIQYSFDIRKIDISENETITPDMKGAEIITVWDIDVYLYNCEQETKIQFIHNGLHYLVSTNDSYEEIVRAVELIE